MEKLNCGNYKNDIIFVFPFIIKEKSEILEYTARCRGTGAHRKIHWLPIITWTIWIKYLFSDMFAVYSAFVSCSCLSLFWLLRLHTIFIRFVFSINHMTIKILIYKEIFYYCYYYYDYYCWRVFLLFDPFLSLYCSIGFSCVRLLLLLTVIFVAHILFDIHVE